MLDQKTLKLLEAVANKRLPWEEDEQRYSRFNDGVLDDFCNLITLNIVMPFSLDMYVQCIKKAYAVDDWFERGIRNWYSQHRPHDYFHDLTLKDPQRWQEWLQQVDRVHQLSEWYPNSAQFLEHLIQEDIFNRNWLTYNLTAPQKLQYIEVLLRSDCISETKHLECINIWQTATHEQRKAANPSLAEWYNHVNDPSLLRWYLKHEGSVVKEVYPLTELGDLST